MQKVIKKDTLKIVALIAMTLDHIAWLFLGEGVMGNLFHIVGRITLPIMCFFIAEGFRYTKSVPKYFTRMMIFTIFSHFAFCYYWNRTFIPFKYGYFSQTSVMFTLTLGVLLLSILSSKMNSFCKSILGGIIFILSLFADYMFLPLVMIVGFYYANNDKAKIFGTILAGSIIGGYTNHICGDSKFAVIQFLMILSSLLLCNYNSKKQKKNWLVNMIYYVYYPLHLFIIGYIYRMV